MESKIVVVTGGFGFLHEGHRLLLEEANKLGTVVVFLNSDKGLLELKGYIPEPFEKRKQRLLDSGLVKYVVSFHSDPTILLAGIRPEYQVLGDDHTIEEVMDKGGEYVGEIIFIPRRPNISSRQIYQERLDGKRTS